MFCLTNATFSRFSFVFDPSLLHFTRVSDRTSSDTPVKLWSTPGRPVQNDESSCEWKLSRPFVERLRPAVNRAQTSGSNTASGEKKSSKTQSVDFQNPQTAERYGLKTASTFIFISNQYSDRKRGAGGGRSPIYRRKHNEAWPCSGRISRLGEGTAKSMGFRAPVRERSALKRVIDEC